MDILRLFRAHDVGRVLDVERKRALYLDEKIKGGDISAAEWKMIARHDRMMAEAHGDST